MITCKSRAEILRMERATRVVHEVLAECAAACVPGTTTEEIDRLAAAGIRARGAKAAFPGYRGYPKTICISVNEEVVHGIPGRRRLRDGDIVGLDLGVIVEGYFGDAARTIPVGTVAPDDATLIRVTQQGLRAGIEAIRPGGRVSDIGAAVEAVARRYNYGVVREFVGHGIGTALHEEPQVPNYGPAGKGDRLRPGMVLAIEPMFNRGTAQVVTDASDRWTVRTKDGRNSAHFEHTVAVTEEGPVVLGFGRYRADGAVVGVPEPGEYPVAGLPMPGILPTGEGPSAASPR